MAIFVHPVLPNSACPSSRSAIIDAAATNKLISNEFVIPCDLIRSPIAV